MSDKQLKYSNTKTKDTTCYLHGKYFETLEDLKQYHEKWPDLPLDIEEFERQMQMRINEAKMNFECSGGRWTNRDAYKLLRMQTDWVEEKDV